MVCIPVGVVPYVIQNFCIDMAVNAMLKVPSGRLVVLIAIQWLLEDAHG